MKRSLAFTLALACALADAACSADHAPTQVTPPSDTTATSLTVSFPAGTITAKIAATIAARDSGLMNVTNLGANAGMLFVFGTDQLSPPAGFWMLDTPIALSIAFMDSTRTVINVDDMAPETTTPHYASRPYRYALEVNQGWFASHGVAAGTTVAFTLPAGTIIDP